MKTVVNIIIGILVLSALFFGAKFMMDKKAAPTGVVQTVQPVNNAPVSAVTVANNISNDDFLALLNAAESINFESDLFNDDVFLGLYDFQQPLPDRPVGRVNPFSPYNQNAENTSVKATTTGRTTTP